MLSQIQRHDGSSDGYICLCRPKTTVATGLVRTNVHRWFAHLVHRQIGWCQFRCFGQHRRFPSPKRLRKACLGGSRVHTCSRILNSSRLRNRMIEVCERVPNIMKLLFASKYAFVWRAAFTFLFSLVSNSNGRGV